MAFERVLLILSSLSCIKIKNTKRSKCKNKNIGRMKMGYTLVVSTKNMSPFLCSLLIYSTLFIAVSFNTTSFIKAEAAEASESQQESDKVVNLPGQPSSPPISQYSGYITVNQDHGRALFYWFFEAQSDPSNKPLLLWLNGGPGCSSVGYGAAVELGPLRVNTHGVGLRYNNYSWNQEANLLFVESPIGVGFSYTNTSSDLTILDDVFVAEDSYNFLVNWLQRFPQFKSHDFFISGESYAGHYVPQLAELIYDRNNETNKYPLINLKGFIVGNPETDDYYDSKGFLEYAWSHSVVSDEVYNKAKQECDFKNFNNWSSDCIEVINVVFEKYSEIDIYNIYVSSCLLNTTSSSSLADSSATFGAPIKEKNNGLWRMRIPGGYDPCFSSYAEEYFNRVDVQSSLHVDIREGNSSVKWQVCNNSILRTYNFTVASILPIYTKLIKGGLKIWVYSGDTDGRVPVIGSRYCMEALGLTVKTPSRSWYHQHQVGGRIVEYEGGLNLITVRGAGHLVPLNKPSEAFALIHSYLSGEDLPTKR